MYCIPSADTGDCSDEVIMTSKGTSAMPPTSSTDTDTYPYASDPL